MNEKIKVIQNIVESLGITFIDIDKDVFKKEDDPLNLFPFKQSGHYTEEGYEKVSKVIYNNIK